MANAATALKMSREEAAAAGQGDDGKSRGEAKKDRVRKLKIQKSVSETNLDRILRVFREKVFTFVCVCV